VKILFVGETWNGSSARSLRDALSELPGVEIEDIGEDHYVPRASTFAMRAIYKLLRPLQRRELQVEILRTLESASSEVLMAYKGSAIGADTIALARQRGVVTVNVFPDCSPHAHGQALKRAVGEYDLVISTKPYHPTNWSSIYGYNNRCVFVPHGFEPKVHYWKELPQEQDLDITMVATWREQYGRTLRDLAASLGDHGEYRVAIAGHGWHQHRSEFPEHWQFPGAIHGRAYTEFARRGKIVIAPLHVENLVGGVHQPGDVDTNRTYQLAAAGCFMLHRRSEYLASVYDEATEVPMWSNVTELASLVRHYLPRESERRGMALAAQQRAVPMYSIQSRSKQIIEFVAGLLGDKGHD